MPRLRSREPCRGQKPLDEYSYWKCVKTKNPRLGWFQIGPSCYGTCSFSATSTGPCASSVQSRENSIFLHTSFHELAMRNTAVRSLLVFHCIPRLGPVPAGSLNMGAVEVQRARVSWPFVAFVHILSISRLGVRFCSLTLSGGFWLLPKDQVPLL